MPIFTPGAKLAAFVYKEIVVFNDMVRGIMIEEGIEKVYMYVYIYECMLIYMCMFVYIYVYIYILNR
jgi:hypothetical protein